MAAAALFGAIFSRYVNGNIIILIFAIMAVTGAILMFIKTASNLDDENPGKVNFNKSLALIISIIVGLFGGMVGAPGAFLPSTFNDYSFKSSG